MLKKIFSKVPSKNGNKDEKKKKKKGKKGKGSVVLEDSFLAKLNLEEQTVDSVVDELTEYLEENDETPGRNGALVELDSGFITAIALDDETIGTIYDEEDEAFGSFVNDIEEDVLPNIRLGSDLENGLLIILPTHDAIQTLSEYDFIQDIQFQWVAIPSEISEDTSSVLCGNTVTYDELVRIDEEQATLNYYADSDEGMSVTFESEDLDEDDVDFAPDDEYEDDYYGDEDYEETFEPEDESYEDYSDFEEGEFDSALPEAESYDELPDGYEDIHADESYDDVYEDEVDDVEETLRQITDDQLTDGLNEIEDYKYHNDEFDITVTDDAFNRHFAIKNFELPLFDEMVSDPNNELDVVMAQQRKDMNKEIIRIHENNIVNLRNEWATHSAKVYDTLVARYNIDDTQTKYGQALKELREKYASLKDGIYLKAQEKMQELDEAYANERKQAGERAFREATERYDLDHKVNLETDKRRVRDELETIYAKELAEAERELRDRRRTEFRREFDKCQTEIFLQLQKYYKQLIKREFANIDHFRLQLDKMARDHYADEVARAKALQRNDDYKQSLEQMKARFTEMNNAKEAELREQMTKYERMDADWNKRYTEMIAKMKQEFDDEVALLQRKNERLQQSLVDIEARKDSESEKRIHTLENLIATQNVQLEQLQASKQKSSLVPIIAAVAVVIALVFGVGGGFMMASAGKQTVQQQPVQQQPTVYAPQNYYGDSHKSDKDDNKASDEKESEKTTESTKSSESKSDNKSEAKTATSQSQTKIPESTTQSK